MVKCDKLPSGSYRCRVPFHDAEGKLKYKSFTAPTKKDAQIAAMEWESRHNGTEKASPTVSEAMERYVESKKNVLSPKTYREYTQLRRNSLQDLHGIEVNDLTQEAVQKAINLAAENHAPKTVRNMHGLLSSSVKMFRPDFTLHTTLPQKSKAEILIPTEDEIKQLISDTHGTDMEIPVLLAALCGLRMSEIVGLKWECVNLSEGTLRIEEAIVNDIDNKQTVKGPKSFAGYRTIRLAPPVIRSFSSVPESDMEEYVTNLKASMIFKRYQKYMSKISTTHYTFHQLRHYCCSVMIMLGIPNKYIADYLGHETEDMVNKVYGHIMRDKTDMFYNRLASYYKDF